MPLKQPLLPMHLFKIRTFVVVVVVGSVGQMVYFALNVLWPQQITALYTTDNMKIGAISVSGFFELARFFFQIPPLTCISVTVHNRCCSSFGRNHYGPVLQGCGPCEMADCRKCCRCDCILWHDGRHQCEYSGYGYCCKFLKPISREFS